MRLNSYYITKCNYKAFNHLCCPDRPTLWNRGQIRKCSARCEFFQQKWVKAIHREEGEKTQTGWRGPWRAPSQLCSFTHLLWVSTKWVTERWGVCLWTGSRVCNVSAGHTGIKAHWRGLWSRVTEKHKVNFCCKNYFVSQTNLEKKYINI